jgi:hypothetical protein
MKRIKSINYTELLAALEEEDVKNIFDETASIPDAGKLSALLEEKIDYENMPGKTVLGIDIYQYSQFEPLKQTLVPFLFNLIYRETEEICKRHSSYIFQNYPDKFKSHFISTGDGGFQIFDTPLHAITFAIQFEMVARYYNSFHFYPKLRKVIGHLNLRYAVTHDKIYSFDNNFYGPSIINNHRILSKDTLNRVLLDENTFYWFMLNMNGVENLQFVSLKDINKLKDFKDYDIEKKSEYENIFPLETDFEFKNIISVDLQKIGNITSKATSLSIYNLHMQYLGGLHNTETDKSEMITISMGNLNTQGID